jgi:isoquinoline 1-oxidoreductase subunit beta
VTFHTEYAGGGFGRRSPFDCHIVREAAAVAKRLRGIPIKLMWTREDDVQGGYYRPVYVHHVEVGMDEQGMPAAWRHVIVGQSWVISSGHWSEPFVTKDGVDLLGTQGTTDNSVSDSQLSRLGAPSEAQRTCHTVAVHWVYPKHIRHGNADR